MSSRMIVFCVLLGFSATLAYLKFKQGELVDSYITLRPDIKISKHDHIYYLGERFNLVALTFVIFMLKRNFITAIIFYIYVLYFLDFKLLFDEPYPGMAWNFAVVMAGFLLILLFIPYGRRTDQINS